MVKLDFLSEQELFVLETNKTNSYTPVENRRIIDVIHGEALKNNLSIVNSKYKVTSGGTQVMGYYDIHSDDADMGIRATYVNSCDKTLSFKFSMGGVVWKCGNGCFSKEVFFKRKHTGSANEEAERTIAIGFEKMEEYFQAIVEARELLKNREISSKVNAELIGRLFMENEILTSVQLNSIKKECLQSENFATVNAVGYSAWDMYNHVTHGLKLSHPTDYLRNHIDFHHFMMNEFV